MNNIRIIDLPSLDAISQKYDFAFFALGYESRCISAARKFSKKQVQTTKIVVLAFNDKGLQFKSNKDEYISMYGDNCFLSPDPSDDIFLYNFLQNNTSGLKEISILIDYSSMSRIWYTAIINWSKLKAESLKVTIDFVYTLGDYKISEEPMVIQDIQPIPGCEGKAFRQTQSVAIFGLGFHGYTALCVLDQIEPDIVYSLLAYPAGDKAYEKKSFNDNKDLLDKSEKVFKLPLHSIEATYRYLSEIVASHLHCHEVTLIPMGPKPHTLASILVALSFPEVTCLRVSHTNDAIDVMPRDEFIITRLSFENPER